MAAKRRPEDQYLQKVGGTWYARVRVPRTLEPLTGQTHIRQSLKTGDRTEANRKKYSVVASIKATLDELRRTPRKANEPGVSFAAMRAMRDEIAAARASGDHERASDLDMVALDLAEKWERLHGPEKAGRYFRAVTSTDETLQDLMGKWLDSSDYKESTKAGHRKALAEVLEFLGDEDAHPADITRRAALSYIDNKLTKRGLADTTMRDRLVSLGGFWSWMASRNAVPSGTNPWTGHKISKKQHAGSRPPKRAYTEAELMQLLAGTEEAKSWPTYSYLPDL